MDKGYNPVNENAGSGKPGALSTVGRARLPNSSRCNVVGFTFLGCAPRGTARLSDRGSKVELGTWNLKPGTFWSLALPSFSALRAFQNWSVIWAWARRTSCNVTIPIGGPSWSATKTRRSADSVTIRLTASFTGVFGETVRAGCGAMFSSGVSSTDSLEIKPSNLFPRTSGKNR
jgi:hypothetical protein